MTKLNNYMSQINFDSFRIATIEKVTTGLTTVTEVLRVVPHSALYHKPLGGDRKDHIQLLNVS